MRWADDSPSAWRVHRVTARFTQRTLRRLVDVGLLVKSGTIYIPADNVAELADRLALELGGAQACARRENQYRDEERQWRETQAWWNELQNRWKELHNQPNVGHWIQPDLGHWVIDNYGGGDSASDARRPAEQADDDHIGSRAEEELRRWYEEQLLLQQLGLPNGLQ